jgi:glycine cleavage system aminomethyltransferase T
VTSGTVSPSTGKAIMLGYVPSNVGADAKLGAVVRGTQRPVRITKLPFVPKRYK